MIRGEKGDFLAVSDHFSVVLVKQELYNLWSL